MGKAVTISPNSSKLTPQTSEDRVISLGKGNRLVLNKHLSGIKKARYLFEPINRDSPDRTSGVNFDRGKCRH